MIRFLENLLYQISIKKKIMGFVIIIIIFLTIQSIYLIQRDYNILNRYNEDNISYLHITQLKKNVVINNNLLNKYFKESTLKNLSNYNDSIIVINKIISKIENNIHTLDEYLAFKAIENSIISYQEEANYAIREKNYNIYMNPYNANRIYEYIKIYTDELLEVSIKNRNDNYSVLLNNWESSKKISMVLVFVIIIIIIFVGIIFSEYLTRNIKEIIKLQSKMSTGDLEIESYDTNSRDEMGDLNRSFNNMQRSIKKKIDDLNEKAIMERRLYQEELKNLEMQKSLNDARFGMLQSQINPHFLFNTLNIISRKAMFDDSIEAVRLIQALSELFRHSMKNASKIISLKKELEIVEEYMYIQKVRYGNRIKFIIENNIGNLEEILIPPLILQPLVENSIIHGLEPKEEPSLLKIVISEVCDKIIIKIVDNGLGMTEQKLHEIMINKKNNQEQSSLGINNVKNRMELFFGRKDCFLIESTLNIGTSVKIIIPIDKKMLE